MANKAKIKCAVCHKTFHSSRPSQLLCDDCERNKRRKEKLTDNATKKAPPATVSVATPGKPTWLVQATVRDATTPFTSHDPAEHRQAPRPAGTPLAKSAAGPKAQVSPAATVNKPPRPPKPPRDAQPPTPPFIPTAEQIQAVEQRYRELAQPEFDGIRTQIAQELHLPKRAVKEIVAALRVREQLPSWWELQSYEGSAEDLVRIRTAYEVYLPVPPVGVHKAIARELALPPTLVYHGISAVRQALGLPVFNPPEAHPEASHAAEALHTSV
jgi:hypothetical protein